MDTYVRYPFKGFLPHAVLHTKGISALLRKPNVIPEKELIGANLAKAFSCPLSVGVGKHTFDGIPERSFVGKLYVEKNIQVSIGIICRVSHHQIKFMKLSGIIDVDTKIEGIVDIPVGRRDGYVVLKHRLPVAGT